VVVTFIARIRNKEPITLRLKDQAGTLHVEEDNIFYQIEIDEDVFLQHEPTGACVFVTPLELLSCFQHDKVARALCKLEEGSKNCARDFGGVHIYDIEGYRFRGEFDATNLLTGMFGLTGTEAENYLSSLLYSWEYFRN
jgi:hypothetical protein